MKILIAEDEEILADATASILRHEGYQVTCVNNGQKALDELAASSNQLATQGSNTGEDPYDIIILDVMMPVKDGIQVAKEIRESEREIKILMLTAKSSVDNKIEGLDAGADDYLTKPFNKGELLARLRALTREKSTAGPLKIGEITLDKEEKKISTSQMAFKLNPQEYKIFSYLHKHQGEQISDYKLAEKISTQATSPQTPAPANQTAASAQTEKQANQGATAVNMYISFLQNKINALDPAVSIQTIQGTEETFRKLTAK